MALSETVKTLLARWSTGFPKSRHESSVLSEPPKSLADCEKMTVASLSRTFHAVRWAYRAEGVWRSL
jgi:hypothetical protein